MSYKELLVSEIVQKFRKKPVVVFAIQYNGINHHELIIFTNKAAKYQAAVGSSDDGNGGLQSYSKLTIHTPEGEMLVSENDWVIQGVKGEFYPCKPDIFADTYEKVNDE